MTEEITTEEKKVDTPQEDEGEKADTPQEKTISINDRLTRIGYFFIILAIIPTLTMFILRAVAEIVFKNLVKVLEMEEQIPKDYTLGISIWLVIWLGIAIIELLITLKERWGIILVKPGTVATIELLHGYSWTAKHGTGIERINCFFYPLEKCRIIEKDEFPEPPYIDAIQKTSYLLDLKVQEIDIPAQQIITKDNAPITIDGFVYGLITDSQKSIYAVKHLRSIIVNLSISTLRVAGGEIKLDELIAEEGKDQIANKVKTTLKKKVSDFGFQVDEVRLKAVDPSPEMKTAMETVPIAERTKRSTITEAEGKSRAKDLDGIGKAKAITSMRESLGGEGFKEKKDGSDDPRDPQGKGGLGPASQVMAYEYMTETLPKMSDGKATKILLPMELSGPASFVTSIVEAVKKNEPEALKKTEESKKEE